jgi:hypothetical protein
MAVVLVEVVVSVEALVPAMAGDEVLGMEEALAGQRLIHLPGNGMDLPMIGPMVVPME